MKTHRLLVFAALLLGCATAPSQGSVAALPQHGAVGAKVEAFGAT